MEREFVLSDETINANGFRVLTSGINLDRFLKNPVMLYQHRRESGVIGRWEHVHKNGPRLIGAPVFDTESELGKEVASKVAGGFLRGASIGIDNVVMEEIRGTMTVTSCTLEEVSIVDIPSNENAVALYKKKNAVTFSKMLQMNLSDEGARLKRVIVALGLPEKASDDEIMARVAYLNGDGITEAYKAITEAEECGAILPAERDFYIGLAKKYEAKDVVGMLAERVKLEKARMADQVENLVNMAIHEMRITGDKRQRYINLGQRIGGATLRQVFDDMRPVGRITDMLGPKAKEMDFYLSAPQDSPDRSQWTLEDWRKNDPVRLQNDPVLYDKLIAQEFKRTKK